MPVKDPAKIAKQAMRTLRHDRDHKLLKIDRYERGNQDMPYTPELADDEYKSLAKRSVTNVMPFLLNTPRQMMKGDSFRRGNTSTSTTTLSEDAVQPVQPEWDVWQRSKGDRKQAAVYGGALKFGHAFVLAYVDAKMNLPVFKGLSALHTAALFEDPANDDDPYVALSITRWPQGDPSDKDSIVGLATMWDDTYEYPVIFTSLEDLDSVVVAAGRSHGATECPVTRFTAAVDLEGRTVGVVEPMMVLQDRINQTVFDLLIVQSYASFKVRTISGMTPPIKLKPVDDEGNTIHDPRDDDPRIVDWVPVLDSQGKPVYDEINLNARRALLAEDKDTKFGTLDETPLDGFISAIQNCFRQFAALAQIPPHFLLGEIANLSADALEAAELSLHRKVGEFKLSFGESWERVFRVTAQMAESDNAEDFNGEFIWQDTENTALSGAADALGKLATQLGVPQRGLWSMIPGVGANQLAEWEKLRKEEPSVALANATTGASGTTSTRPSFRSGTTQPVSQGGSDAA